MKPVWLALMFLLEGRPADGTGFSSFPKGVVSNAQMRVEYYLPDATHGYYQGLRFDWSGLISRVDWQGHTFFCEFKRQHDPLNHDDICGSAEEFSMISPPGYDEAKPGETFIKIGVGVLTREHDEPYGFWRRYPISFLPPWTVSQTADSVAFSQELRTNGWGYAYTKIIRIETNAPVLSIIHRFRNIGEKPFATDHYGHNFLQIDGVPAGPDYEIEYPFTIRFGESTISAGCIQANGGRLNFTREVGTNAVWALVEGYELGGITPILVKNCRTGASVQIRSDQPLVRHVVYSSNGAVCPEPFVRIVVAPGESKEWTTTYTFKMARSK